ncbi:Fumarate reductase/succinate dehydrogenase flavoprotein-like protein [Mycobacteroides abscessus subsp. abscessus]|uniref:FAD-dependent oxidoreductase n=1 Tax=Mycobacteroides abscessus TaxID=36809 RepID=UPI0009A713EE|nr:FAD-binding protein [Mycobacteroides abscessus]SLI10640.1 Fumarate reductase/succinate dehydrogenase flavoprotein-like protein [Mycobacteroides abscessus subsp. abscessus]
MSSCVELKADVLIVGGGPAATWAALSASRSGADVVLVDKGYCGTSGATASAGTGVWYVPPESEAREEAVASRERLGGYLADRRWSARVLDETFDRVNELAVVARFPFPVGPDGEQLRNGLQGPEYMRRMRSWIRRAGVRILDHSPVTELLVDSAGAVAGAAGYRRQERSDFRVRAGAVVLATGGCAFQSKALGCDVNTGDGALFAVEAGAELSGMEFSNAYGIAPEGTSVTKTAFYRYATFYRSDGSVLEGASGQQRSPIAAELLRSKVYCQLDRADEPDRAAMRRAQPNFFLTFDRMGIDPFTERFAVTLLAEGTVRGTGGVRITGDDCATTVPGLYAAGDTATRELICGGFTGGGSHNAAWAISSGTWAGRGAARYSRSLGTSAATRGATSIGHAGARPTTAHASTDHRAVVAAVQREVLPYDKNYLRHGQVLTAALSELDDIWTGVRETLWGDAEQRVRTRQAAAMTAHARWMYHTALQREETRGMAKRLDHPELDPAQQHRLITSGLDEIWVRPETLALTGSAL